MTHLSLPSNRFVWLTGSPGTGKTAISKSVAIELKSQGRLAASFYFDKTGTNQFTDSADLFASTLARQLADFHPPYRHTLFRYLRTNHGNYPHSQVEQLNELIIARVEEHKDMPFPPSVIVLDGLDECEDGSQKTLECLMILVLELLKLPRNIQVLVSSRPERAISNAWSRHPETKSIVTEDVDNIRAEVNRADIAKYIHEHIKSIPDRGSTNWPPSIKDMDEFADQCQGIFEIARIRVRFLEGAPSGMQIDIMFKDLLLDTKSSPEGVSQFAAEYHRILRRAFPSPEEMREPPLTDMERKWRRSARNTFCTVIGAMLGVRGPTTPDGITVDFLSFLLGIDKSEVMAVLTPLSSIIKIQPGIWFSKVISFFHATCSEFFRGKFNGPEAGVDDEFMFKDTIGAVLCAPCLKLLAEKLNPGQILLIQFHESSFAIRYAFSNWAYHLDLTSPSSTLLDTLRLFLSQYFLVWLEFLWITRGWSLADEVQAVQSHLRGLLEDQSIEVCLTSL